MHETEKDRPMVRIHIDREPYDSPSPTTGEALYALARVPPDYEIFSETSGPHEDDPVPRNTDIVHPTQDEHFYSQHEFRIIINGTPKETPKRELLFDEVVHLAYANPPTGPNVLFTITYRKGPRYNREGSLLEGHSVFIRKGMIFNVVPTDKS